MSIFRSKSKIKQIEKEKSLQKIKLEKRKKEIGEILQEISIVLYKQDQAKKQLGGLHKRVGQLEKEQAEREGQLEILVLENGVLCKFKQILNFIKQRGEQFLKRCESWKSVSPENLNKVCFTNKFLKDISLDIVEYYHTKNRHINNLAQRFKKFEERLKNKKKKTKKIQKQLSRQSSLYLKVESSKNSFGEIMKSFIGDENKKVCKEIRPINLEMPQSVRGVRIPQKDKRAGGEEVNEEEKGELQQLQDAVGLNDSLLKKVEVI